MRKIAAVFGTVLVVAAGCNLFIQEATEGAPYQPAEISDGAQETGNPDFFFLPPLVFNPSSDPNFDVGDFVGGLSLTCG